jgi:hypothetical protein
MRGVDGNYIKMQGEMLARMQVAYQAEQTAQQTRAQAQSLESLRQLREQVDVAAKADTQNHPPRVDEKKEGHTPSRDGRKASRAARYGPAGQTQIEEREDPEPRGNGHVDVRI